MSQENLYPARKLWALAEQAWPLVRHHRPMEFILSDPNSSKELGLKLVDEDIGYGNCRRAELVLARFMIIEHNTEAGLELTRFIANSPGYADNLYIADFAEEFAGFDIERIAA